MFPRGAGTVHGSKSARVGQRDADGADHGALHGRRLHAAAADCSQWALCDGAVGRWDNQGALERSTVGRAEQSGDLCADGYAAVDCRHPNAGQWDVAVPGEDEMNLDFPFHFSRSRVDGRGRAAMTDDDDHLRDMIEQFLFTNPGERLNRPDFGSGLLQMVFAGNSPELAAALQFTVQAGLQRWLGDLIAIERLDVTNKDGELSIHIHYLVRRTNEPRTAQFVRKV